MVTEFKKEKEVVVKSNAIELYGLRCAMRRLDIEGKPVGEVAMRLEDDEIPAGVKSALEELQRKIEEGELDAAK